MAPRSFNEALGAIVLIVGALGAAFAGYAVEVFVLRDAERAIPGFMHGVLAFALAATLTFFVLRSKPRMLMVAWVSLLLVAWLFVAGSSMIVVPGRT